MGRRDRGHLGRYRVEADYDQDPSTDTDDTTWTTDDAYRFPPTLGELDLHLFGEGRDEQLWKHLGAHVRTIDGVDGVAFSVWAPRATAVRVIGDFEGWEGRTTAMRRLDDLGVWELFWARRARGPALQVPDPDPTAAGSSARTRSRVEPRSHRSSVGHHELRLHLVRGGRRVDAAARGSRPRTTGRMSVYEVHLGVVASGAELPRGRGPAHRARAVPRGSPRRVPAALRDPSAEGRGATRSRATTPRRRASAPDDLRYLIDGCTPKASA